jgi:hypothetical protein
MVLTVIASGTVVLLFQGPCFVVMSIEWIEFKRGCHVNYKWF